MFWSPPGTIAFLREPTKNSPMQMMVEMNAIRAVLLNSYHSCCPKKPLYSKSSLTLGRRSARTGITQCS